MIEKLLSAPIVVVTATETHSQAPCYAEEMDLVKNAVAKRKQEFISARNCAREGLAHFGIENFPVLRGKNRQPLWPKDIVGSITHCKDYCAVALSRWGDYQAIGIDAEENSPLKQDTHHLILTDSEIKKLKSRNQLNSYWTKLIFSIKECVFKCYFPLCHEYLDFLQAEIIFVAGNKFQVKLLVPPPPQYPQFEQIEGNYAVGKNHVFSALALPTQT